MIALATLPGISIMTFTPVTSFAAFYRINWGAFWNRALNILLRFAEAYLEKSLERGYFLVPVPGSQIASVFDTQEAMQLAMTKGLVYDGNSLTIQEDIVIYVKDDVGVALQKGEYLLDGSGNFNFNLIKVINPVPSTTFPLSGGGDE